jgi:hypothetical protein
MFQLTPRPSKQGVSSKAENGRHCCLFACAGRDFQVRCGWTEEWSNRRGNRPRKLVIKACESKQIGGVAFSIPASLPYLGKRDARTGGEDQLVVERASGRGKRCSGR